MRRVISFFITLAVLLSFLSTARTSLASNNRYAELLSYIDVEATDNNTIDVSLYITPQYEMDILGMNFSIDYSYSFDRNEYPFVFNKNKVYLHENFSDATIVANTSTNSRFDYYWDSASPITVSADKSILLARFSLDVTDDANDGEYVFNLTCKDFYRAVTLEGNGSIDIADVTVDTSLGNVTFWYGKKLEATCHEVSIVQSGVLDLSHTIFLNKTISSNLCYIQDTSIATIEEIDNMNTSSTISIVGRKVGTTRLFITGGYNDSETIMITIHVVAPTPYIMTIHTPPAQTTYNVGEDLDLSGLELRVEYNNYDVEYITYSDSTASDFTIDAYDFSTAGVKTIKITYENLSVYLDVTVKSSDVLRGDMNGDNLVTDADAIHLLYYTFFPNDYPLNQNGDFNGDELITDADAIYLLYHTFFPYDYPLN